MGYEDSRFRAAIGREFHCSVCNLVADLDFVMETRCNHLFCRSCFDPLFQQNHQCPVSGHILKLGHLKRGALWALAYWNLKSFKISCDFRENGCEKTVALGRLAEHVSRCSFRYPRLFNQPRQQVMNAVSNTRPRARPQTQNEQQRQRLNVTIQERNNTRNSFPLINNLRRTQSVFHIALEPSTSEESIDDQQRHQSSRNYSVSSNPEAESVEPLISFDDDCDQEPFTEFTEKKETAHSQDIRPEVCELAKKVQELTISIDVLKNQVLYRQERDLDSLRSLEPHFTRLKSSLTTSVQKLNSLNEEARRLRLF